MKKIVLFVALLLVAILPKIGKTSGIFKTSLALMPDTTSLITGYNPFAIGIATGTFVASAITGNLNINGKGYKSDPKKSFSMALASFEKINKIL